MQYEVDWYCKLHLMTNWLILVWPFLPTNQYQLLKKKKKAGKNSITALGQYKMVC